MKALEDCYLITLAQQDYVSMMQNLSSYKLDGMADFFRNLPRFHNCKRSVLMELAQLSKHVKYNINTLVLRQGDRPQSLYFVKSGRFKVLRKVEFRIPTQHYEASNIDFLVKDPTDDEINAHKAESKLLEVDELLNGDVFADYASILQNEI